ncbi:hypothetical protein DFJ74DRAFT_764315 [Hyaloraphidium curvatum]|nr:hypothetical protein DFJ74DRAFT_764315 [Hyaloraphidium curvatum]
MTKSAAPRSNPRAKKAGGGQPGGRADSPGGSPPPETPPAGDAHGPATPRDAPGALAQLQWDPKAPHAFSLWTPKQEPGAAQAPLAAQLGNPVPLANGADSWTRQKRPQVRNACVHCQRACKKCDNNRPCDRCVRLGLTGCVDSQRKSRKKHGQTPSVGDPAQLSPSTAEPPSPLLASPVDSLPDGASPATTRSASVSASLASSRAPSPRASGRNGAASASSSRRTSGQPSFIAKPALSSTAASTAPSSAASPIALPASRPASGLGIDGLAPLFLDPAPANGNGALLLPLPAANGRKPRARNPPKPKAKPAPAPAAPAPPADPEPSDDVRPEDPAASDSASLYSTAPSLTTEQELPGAERFGSAEAWEEEAMAVDAPEDGVLDLDVNGEGDVDGDDEMLVDAPRGPSPEATPAVASAAAQAAVPAPAPASAPATALPSGVVPAPRLRRRSGTPVPATELTVGDAVELRAHLLKPSAAAAAADPMLSLAAVAVALLDGGELDLSGEMELPPWFKRGAGKRVPLHALEVGGKPMFGAGFGTALELDRIAAREAKKPRR